MKPLYTQEEFEVTKATELLPLECEECKKPFHKHKRYINSFLKHGKNKYNACRFCSRECDNKNRFIQVTCSCTLCGKEFTRTPSSLTNKKLKSNRTFCSSSCAATYNNTHKKHGIRRSKLEKWIEKELTKKYPNLDIKYNNLNAVKLELDIYIPSLKLAFEVNGIFHYKPIYGQQKLAKIQNNDSEKAKRCKDKNIDLTIIDISDLRHFKAKEAKKYLDIIIDKIESE